MSWRNGNGGQVASSTGTSMGISVVAPVFNERECLPEFHRRVAAVLDLPGPLIGVPDRLVELIGAGPNAWTAQEGALKIREASYVAAEGLSSEQFFHGPSVALDEQDTLVVLDGGGPAADRTEPPSSPDG